MIKDKIKLNNDYKQSLIHCFACQKTSHTLNECPMLHFIPDSQFLIHRFLYSTEQIRDPSFLRKNNKKKLNALAQNLLIQRKVLALDVSLFPLTSEEEIENTSKNENEDHDFNEFEDKFQTENLQIEEENDKIKMNLPNYPSFNEKEKDFDISYEKNEKIQKEPISVLRVKENNSAGSCNLKQSENLKKQNSLSASLENLPKFKNIKLSKGKESYNDNQKELFIFEFDSLKNYEAFFPEGNPNKIILKIKSKKLLKLKSPTNRSPRQSLTKHLRRRRKCSKLIINCSLSPHKLDSSPINEESFA